MLRPSPLLLPAILLLAACGHLPTTPAADAPPAPSFLYADEYYTTMAAGGCDPAVDPRCELRALSTYGDVDEWQIFRDMIEGLCAEVQSVGMMFLQSGSIQVWDAYLGNGMTYLSADWHGDGPGGEYEDEIHVWSGNYLGEPEYTQHFGRSFAHEVYHYLYPDEDHDWIRAEAASCVAEGAS